MSRKKRKTTEVPEEQRPLIKRLNKGKNSGKNDERAEPGLDEAIADGLRESIVATGLELAIQATFTGGAGLALQAGKGLKPIVHNAKKMVKKGAKPFAKNVAEQGVKKTLEEEKPEGKQEDPQESPFDSIATELGENAASDMIIQGISKHLGR